MRKAGRQFRRAPHDIVVERPRLIRALEDSPGRAVVLRAPAGFGKTTLARQWVATVKESVWYRAGAASRDLAALALGLNDAMSAVDSGVVASSPRRLLAEGVEPTRLAELLLEALPGWPREAWLVIDDYQWIAGTQPCELFIERVVELEQVNLLVATRARPSWATARRLLYGKVLELTQSVLAMTPREALEVFRISGVEGRSIAANAHGWPAVISLAARAADRDASSEITERLPEELHRFFAEELFQHLPKTVRYELTALAIAPRLDEDLLSALLGNRVQEFLAESMEAGFLTQLGSEFEIHPLLRDFLATKLPDIPQERIGAVGEQLVAHYLQLGQLDEAFAVAERRRAHHLLTRTCEAGFEELLAAGRLTTLERWIRVARNEGVQSPVLGLAEAEIDLRTGKLQRACARAQEVAKAVQPHHDLQARAWFVAGQSAHLDNRAEDAVRLLRKSCDASTNGRDRFRALLSTLLVQMELEAVADAEKTLRLLEAEHRYEAEDKLRLEQARLLFAIRTGGIYDKLARAEAVRASMPAGVDPVAVTGFLHTLSHAYGLHARYDEAATVSEEVLEYATRFGLDFVVPHSLCERATAKLGQRQFVNALADVERAFDRAAAIGDLHSEMNSLSIAAKVYLCQHEPERALSVLSGVWERPANRGMAGDYFSVQGLAFACSGDWRNAERAVQRSEEASALSQGRVLRRFVKAIIAVARQDSRSRDLLKDALDETSRTGNFDAFVVAYRSHPDMLAHLRLKKSSTAGAIRTLERVDPGLAERAGLVLPRPRGRAHKKLTNREAEILGLIRQGLSNKQIATTLWISESTAKLHVHHILEKLGAKSRTEAAALGDG